MRCEVLDRGSEKWTETLKDGGMKQIEALNFESWVAYVAWRHEADSSHEWPGKDDEDVWAGYGCTLVYMHCQQLPAHTSPSVYSQLLTVFIVNGLPSVARL